MCKYQSSWYLQEENHLFPKNEYVLRTFFRCCSLKRFIQYIYVFDLGIFKLKLDVVTYRDVFFFFSLVENVHLNGALVYTCGMVVLIVQQGFLVKKKKENKLPRQLLNIKMELLRNLKKQTNLSNLINCSREKRESLSRIKLALGHQQTLPNKTTSQVSLFQILQ